MTEREKIAAKIRALRAKTVENGCTEDEAMAAAAKVAEMLARYNMTLDEAEMRKSPFERHREQHNDLVGQKLWKVAAGVAELTGATFWTDSRHGGVEIHFFGFEHEVEVAKYLFEVCAGAMRRVKRQEAARHQLLRPAQRLVKVMAFIDGMADRLYQRLCALKPPPPTGKGLVVLHKQLVKAALKEIGVELTDAEARRRRDFDEQYERGVAAGDRVSLNQALAGSGQGQALLG